MKQLSLIPTPPKEHGGSLGHNKRKTFKPLSFKKATHLVLKAKKSAALFKNRHSIITLLRRQSELSGARIYKLSVQHDHIHFSALFSSKKQYSAFIRAVTGILARTFGRGLWKLRPYTRIVEWGRDYKNLSAYIDQNENEIFGRIPYQPRK